MPSNMHGDRPAPDALLQRLAHSEVTHCVRVNAGSARLLAASTVRRVVVGLSRVVAASKHGVVATVWRRAAVDLGGVKVE